VVIVGVYSFRKDLETAKTISGNPSLTREELKSFKETAKDKQEIESNI
jgi:hypothetical protein